MRRIVTLPLLLSLCACCLGSGCSRSGFSLHGDGATDRGAPGDGPVGGKRLRIVTGEPNAPLEPRALELGDNLDLRAAAFDARGAFIEAVPAVWSIIGGGFAAGDLDWTPPASIDAVFTPTRLGSATLFAVVLDSGSFDQGSVVVGPLTVVNDGAAAQLAVVSGDQQRGTVGEPLAAPFVVRVTDLAGRPVAGASVTFAATLGEGAVVDPASDTADAEGLAQARATLGLRAGEANHRFSAELDGVPAARATFTASAVAADPAQLRFETQPGGLVAGRALTTQPVVSLHDAHGNRVPSTDDVTLTVQSGTGTLIGGTVAAMAAGAAAFIDVGYSKAEAGVVLRASAAGLSVDSAPLTFEPLPAGACLLDDEAFATADGGCKDLETGLVWSSSGPRRLPGLLLWDARRNASAQPEVHDLGRTNDYDPGAGNNACPTLCDNDSRAYCHELKEGGRLDWRVPTAQDLLTLSTNLTTAGGPRIAGMPGEGAYPTTHYSATASRAGWVRTVDLVSGLTGEGPMLTTTALARSICMRGGWTSDVALEVVSQPSTVGVDSYPLTPLIVQLRDSAGYRVFSQGTRVTVSSTQALGGELTSVTDAGGRAVLDRWQVGQVGRATLSISAAPLPGLTTSSTPTSVELDVGPFPHSCAKQTENWVSADGGCKQTRFGLVWSKPGGQMTWHRYIWDSAYPTGGGAHRQPDAHDAGRTHDYTGARPVGGGFDESFDDYCHDLVEGGHRDWRAASRDELLQAHTDEAAAHWSAPASTLFLSATTVAYRRGDLHLVNVAAGSESTARKDDGAAQHLAICVRRSP